MRDAREGPCQFTNHHQLRKEGRKGGTVNLYELTRDRQQRETAASYDGFFKGRADGIDTGRTEAFNEVRDRVDSSTRRIRLNKERLKDHLTKKG